MSKIIAVKPAPKILTFDGLLLHGYIDKDTYEALEQIITDRIIEELETTTCHKHGSVENCPQLNERIKALRGKSND